MEITVRNKRAGGVQAEHLGLQEWEAGARPRTRISCSVLLEQRTNYLP